MARYDSKFLETFVLLRSSNLPNLNGSAKRLRSPSVKWFLPVILGNASQMLPELFWLENFMYFDLTLCSKSMLFVVMF